MDKAVTLDNVHFIDALDTLDTSDTSDTLDLYSVSIQPVY